MRRNLPYSTYFDNRWVGQGDQRTKNSVILKHEPFAMYLRSIRYNDKDLFDIKFSKYRVFIRNNTLPEVPTISENSMFQHLQQFFIFDEPINIKGILENIRYTYKIHIQAKDEHMLDIMESIINIISNDNRLTDTIPEMKFMTQYGLAENPTGELPRIVIYIKPLYNHNDMNEAVKYVLHKIVNGLRTKTEMGTGITPRYNHKINDLVYYAQGHGLLKDKILNSGNQKLIELMDADSGYAHFDCPKIGYPDDDCHVSY